MKHKNICPICGKQTYLHSKTLNGYTTMLYWICDECDKSFEIRFTKRWIDGTMLHWICDECDKPFEVIFIDSAEELT